MIGKEQLQMLEETPPRCRYSKGIKKVLTNLFVILVYFSYIYIIKMINKEKKVMDKLQEIKVTQQEWNDALRVPTPHRNKKKYYRKDKHKNSWRS